MYNVKCNTGKGNRKVLALTEPYRPAQCRRDLQACLAGGEKVVPKVVVKLVVATEGEAGGCRREAENLELFTELCSWNRNREPNLILLKTNRGRPQGGGTAGVIKIEDITGVSEACCQ